MWSTQTALEMLIYIKGKTRNEANIMNTELAIDRELVWKPFSTWLLLKLTARSSLAGPAGRLTDTSQA